MKYVLRRRARLWLCLLPFGWLGCSVPVDTEEVEPAELTESTSQALYLNPGFGPWPQHTVDVCWTQATLARPDFVDLSLHIRNQALASWGAVGNLRFTHWNEACGSSTLGRASINIVDSLGPNISGRTEAVGGGGITVAAQINLSEWAVRNQHTVKHEFGHALGLAHPFADPRFEDEGTCAGDNNDNGDTLNTPAERESIMGSGYCHENTSLTFWDQLGFQELYGLRAKGLRPLATFYREDIHDRATMTRKKLPAAPSDGDAFDWLSNWYEPVGADGWVWGFSAPETVPLAVYYHPTTRHFMTVATANGKADAQALGYVFQMNTGFVYPSEEKGTIPLNILYHPGRQDYLTTADEALRQQAQSEGYIEVRTEGWVFKARPYYMMWQYWGPAALDHALVRQAGVPTEPDNLGYEFGDLDGAVLRWNVPGTKPLRVLYNSSTGDFLTARRQNLRDWAATAGFEELGIAGYVFTDPVTDAAYVSTYHKGNDDFLTTADFVTYASLAGYTTLQVEGYGLELYR